MMNETQKLLSLAWIGILIVELFYLYVLTERPHSTSDLVFRVTVIAVTLVVGAVIITIWRRR